MEVFQARKRCTRSAGDGRINSPIKDLQFIALLLEPSKSPEDDTIHEIRFQILIGVYSAGSGSEEE